MRLLTFDDDLEIELDHAALVLEQELVVAGVGSEQEVEE